MTDKLVGVLIGTRPGIIKMSPLVHELRQRGLKELLIHTGQHFSEYMDRKIMNDVGLPNPDVQIRRPRNCVSHAQQTAYMLTAIEKVLISERPQILLVCGDANTNLAGALAARKIHVKVGHVEAGLRSFDWRMPEEHNRVIIDHISEYLFAPTQLAKSNLTNENVRGRVFVVGNTIVDATFNHLDLAIKQMSSQLRRLTDQNEYVVLTLHREENVDDATVLRDLIRSVESILSSKWRPSIIFPVHPRTRKRIEEAGLTSLIGKLNGLRLTNPFSYLDFLAVLSKAKLVMTDSGGVQEEACILGVPCITLRENTERPETVEAGANQLAGTSPDRIVEAFNDLMILGRSIKTWENPYGDGKAAPRIIDVCLDGTPRDELLSK